MSRSLTQAQREAITAALFRREDTKSIADVHSISERQVRRIHQNLQTYGTVSAPRTKKMGRPNVLTKEIEEDLKVYVSESPLALLEDMQAHIQSTFHVRCSRASLSRRMKELGFTRGIIRRGFRSADQPLPPLSQVDYERLLISGVAEHGFGEDAVLNDSGLANGNSKKSKYAWLLGGEPMPRTEGQRNKKRRGMTGSSKIRRASGASKRRRRTRDEEDLAAQTDLERTGLDDHEDEMDLQILGNVASDSQYALPMEPQQGDLQHQQLHDNFHEPQQFERSYLPPSSNTALQQHAQLPQMSPSLEPYS